MEEQEILCLDFDYSDFVDDNLIELIVSAIENNTKLKKISLNLDGMYISEFSANKLLECQKHHHNFLVYTDSEFIDV